MPLFPLQLGFPVTGCKTVLVGSDPALLQCVLVFLSFFLRSSLGVRNRVQLPDALPNGLLDEPMASSSASSKSVSPLPSPSPASALKRSSRRHDLLGVGDALGAGGSRQEAFDDGVTFEIGENERLVHPEHCFQNRDRPRRRSGTIAAGGSNNGSNDFDDGDIFVFEDVPIPTT